jgi:HSP20 family protein
MFGLIPTRERKKVGYPLTELHDEFKALYDRVFGGWPVLFEPYMAPERFWGLEMKETEKEVVVRAELPGFEPAEVEVEMRETRLSIRAEKKPKEVEKKPKEEKKPTELARFCYERFVELPVAVVPEKAEACYRNGVLEVHLPKTEEEPIRRIPVKGALPS